MMKSFFIALLSTASASAFGYPYYPQNCVPTQAYNVPGYTCTVYDPYLHQVIPGPFVPYEPYASYARNAQSQYHNFVVNDVNNLHQLQLDEFERRKSFFDANPWPKPYGYDEYFDTQKKFLEYAQQHQNMNINNMNAIREQVLGKAPSSSTPVSSGSN